jgi:hypothetical protein
MDTKPNAPANLTHGLPKDEKLLAAIGRIALVHAQLDNQLRMTVKDLVGVTQEEALDATARQSSGELRKRIWKLGRTRLGDGPALVRLQALLQRASRATEGRNQLLHSVWGRDPDGRGDYLRGEDHHFQPAPTAKELEEALIVPLNTCHRLQHFQRPTPSNFSPNASHASHRGDEHMARGRRGRLRFSEGQPHHDLDTTM